MGKSSGQNLLHTCIIVRTLNPFDLEFAVIAAFRAAFFINDHGTYRLKAADIGDIVGFHADYTFKSQPVFYLMNCADGTSFFSPDLLSVFGKNHAGIFQGKFYQFLLGTFLRDTNMHFLLSSGSKPFFDNIRILDLTLEHDLRRDKRCSCIKLLQEA